MLLALFDVVDLRTAVKECRSLEVFEHHSLRSMKVVLSLVVLHWREYRMTHSILYIYIYISKW